MKKYFENIKIDCWLPTGRFGRMGLCICMWARPESAEVLLRAINEVARETPPAKRKLTFDSKRPDAFHSIQLRFCPETAELRKFCISIENGTPVLEFTAAGLNDVKSHLESWIKGVEDFCLYPRGKKSELGDKDRVSRELWFWVTMLPQSD